MPSNRIVDASPLILLAKTGQLELLRLGVVSVIVPEVVMDEVRAKGPDDPATRAVAQARWLTFAPKSTLVPAVEMEGLDPGETAALSLAVDDPEAEVVIDDRAGRECARRLGIPCQGTLGIISSWPSASRPSRPPGPSSLGFARQGFTLMTNSPPGS